MKKKALYYPLFLDLTGHKCVVVGGGEVALRKVQTLLEHGAIVEVMSPRLSAGLKKLGDSGVIKITGREYQPGDLVGARLAVAATGDRSANDKIAREARERGVLVNVVDEPELCDFIVPSCLRRGDLTIAISTGGRSPALARKVRTILEREFGPEYAALTSLLEEVRAEVRRRGIILDGERWQEALDLDTLLGLLRKGEREKAREFLLRALEAH